MTETFYGNPREIVRVLFSAAEIEDFDEIDTKIVPYLRNVDGGEIAEELLSRVEDINPNNRDAVATTLTACNIDDREILRDAVKKMIKMAVSDPEKFPAGRAVMFLWKYHNDEEFKDKIQIGIDQFKRREEIVRWKKDLITNIDGIDELFGMVG